MLLKFPTTKTHFTFSAPAAQLIVAEMSQAQEQRNLFFILKALAASLSLCPLVYPSGRKKKGEKECERRKSPQENSMAANIVKEILSTLDSAASYFYTLGVSLNRRSKKLRANSLHGHDGPSDHENIIDRADRTSPHYGQ